MDVTTYIKPELLILVPVLYLIGVGLKKSALPDKLIPTALGAIAIALCLVWVIASSETFGWQDILLMVFTGIVQGILLAGASVYANQLTKQAIKDE